MACPITYGGHNYLEPVMYYNCSISTAIRQTKLRLHFMFALTGLQKLIIVTADFPIFSDFSVTNL